MKTGFKSIVAKVSRLFGKSQKTPVATKPAQTPATTMTSGAPTCGLPVTKTGAKVVYCHKMKNRIKRRRTINKIANQSRKLNRA